MLTCGITAITGRRRLTSNGLTERAGLAAPRGLRCGCAKVLTIGTRRTASTCGRCLPGLRARACRSLGRSGSRHDRARGPIALRRAFPPGAGPRPRGRRAHAAPLDQGRLSAGRPPRRALPTLSRAPRRDRRLAARTIPTTLPRGANSMNAEVRERLNMLIEDLHRLANPPIKLTGGQMKREIRGARDTLRQLVEEFSL